MQLAAHHGCYCAEPVPSLRFPTLPASLLRGLQIAASPTLEYVAADEIPPEVFQKELEVEMGREDLQSKVQGAGKQGRQLVSFSLDALAPASAKGSGSVEAFPPARVTLNPP